MSPVDAEVAHPGDKPALGPAQGLLDGRVLSKLVAAAATASVEAEAEEKGLNRAKTFHKSMGTPTCSSPGGSRILVKEPNDGLKGKTDVIWPWERSAPLGGERTHSPLSTL